MFALLLMELNLHYIFNMKKISLRLLFASALLAFSGIAFGAETILLCGSDLMAPILKDEILKQAKENGIGVKLDMVGSFGALEKIKRGECDIAVVAIPKGSSFPKDCAVMPFAYQAAIVVVNVVNPIEEISLNQLYDIFSKNSNSRAETWTQLGVKNIGLRNILPLITSFSDNVVVELFKYSALKGTNIGSWVNVAGGKQNMYNMIKANNSAIGIVGKFDGDNMLKVVAVSKSSDGGGRGNYAFRPDSDSIHNGDYPMSLGFYIVCRKSALEKVRPLAAILLSDSMARTVNSTDFFSAPENSRKKSILELDMGR